MYETIPHDHQFAQKAREYLRQLEEIFEAEQRHNSQELRNVLLYLNNLIPPITCAIMKSQMNQIWRDD